MTNDLYCKVSKKWFITIVYCVLVLCVGSKNASAQIKITYEIDNVFSLQNAPPKIVLPEAKMKSTLRIFENYSTWTDESIFLESFGGSEDLKMYVKSKHLFKIYNEKLMYYRRVSNSKGEFFVKQKKNREWKIEKNRIKYILGFKCMKAVFGKSDYQIEAWFTRDLIYSDGPDFYAFNLPGTILELSVSGEGKHYKAVNIEVAKSLEGKTLPPFKIEHLSKEEINNFYLNQDVPQNFIIRKSYPLNTWVDITVK